MPDIESRMESMLFNYQTTYKADFRHGKVTPPTYTTYKKKPTCLRIRPPPLKNVHTLTAWKSERIPFNLVHTPRPIIGTAPNKVQEPYVKLPDTKKAEAIKTRPRVVLTPAVSLDDVTNPQTREILCKYMYTSNMTRATREAIAEYFTVKAPLPGLPAPANPITLPQLQFPYVSPEWRMETVSWDKQQLRSYCDSTKEFWLKQELPPCRACKETAIVEADRKLRYQMKP